MSTTTKFKQYQRKEKAELTPITESHIASYVVNKKVYENYTEISISQENIKEGSPKLGDMIARNPKNHKDQWLIAEKYFKDNFEPVK